MSARPPLLTVAELVNKDYHLLEYYLAGVRVIEWASLYQEELMEDWNLAEKYAQLKNTTIGVKNVGRCH